jgi:hypothetical protein
MYLHEAMTADPKEREIVEELTRPRTTLERWYGSAFRAEFERVVEGNLREEGIASVRRRVADTLAINEAGGGGFVREHEHTDTRIEWRIMGPSGSTPDGYTTGPHDTGDRVVLVREPERTRIQVRVALGSPWLLLMPPGLAVVIFGVAPGAGTAIGGIVVGGLLWGGGRRGIRKSSEARVRGVARTLATIEDAVRDASSRLPE